MATTTESRRGPQARGPLDEVRAALTLAGEDLRTGGRDLYGDVATLVRSTRRDTVKLGKALHGDVERLVKYPAPPHALPTARRRAAARPRKTPA